MDKISEYDHIRQMSDEEMANWIFGIVLNCLDCFLYRRDVCDRSNCYDTILAWLRSPQTDRKTVVRDDDD